MDSPSSVYKSLHEYRILRVSNSHHLYELCVTLSVAKQPIPLCMVLSFTKYLAYLKYCQVWLLALSHSSNSIISTFVHYVFFPTCLSSWCLSLKGLAIPLNINFECSLIWVTHFPTSLYPSLKQLHVLVTLNAIPLGPPHLHVKYS